MMRNSAAEGKIIALILLGLVAASWPATAQTVSLGEAEEETIFDRMALTNTVASFTPRNLALSPWTDVTDFLPDEIGRGTIHINDAYGDQATAGAFAAYTHMIDSSFASVPIPALPPPVGLGGAGMVTILGATTVTNTGPSIIYR